MPKMKTNSAAKKRFKKLKGGKVKRASSLRRHIMTKKTQKRKRQSRQGGYICKSDMKSLLALLPN
ncbi:50S ribosomal protein L35 [Candidatus Babeliales bacterium]|nr:50S ribosomal protein L35 [Candidatus Babeliales bacterium]